MATRPSFYVEFALACEIGGRFGIVVDVPSDIGYYVVEPLERQ